MERGLGKCNTSVERKRKGLAKRLGGSVRDLIRRSGAFLTVAALLSWIPSNLGAQNLNEDVLRNSDLSKIVFENYVGPHQVVETRASIQSIGTSLGQAMKANPTKPAIFENKYTVVRVSDPNDPKLSADVFILSPNSGVDHIRNLNWIVASYLKETFGYSQENAELLADFVTRYNAVYRGKLDYFQKNYIAGVNAQLTAETAGLALKYSDWPGKTRMVIPLRDSLSKGKSGLINADEVSNPDVIKKVKESPDSGLDTRKKITDLKEAEIVTEKKTIAQKEQDIANQEKKLAEDKAKLNASPSPAVTPKPSASPQAGTSNPQTTPQATVKASPQPTPASTVQTTKPTPQPSATPAVTKESIAQQEKKIAEDKKAVETAKTANDARDKQLQTERKDIAKDQKTQDEKHTTPAANVQKAPTQTAPFLLVNSGSGFGQLLLIDVTGKRVWKTSEVNSIRRQAVQSFADGYLVTAGEAKGNGAVRLMILKKDDLSVSVTGGDDASPDGSVVLAGNSAYAVVKNEKGEWVVGLFDTKLASSVKSTEPVQPNTSISVQPGLIIVQGSSGKPIFLDPKTLKKIGETEG